MTLDSLTMKLNDHKFHHALAYSLQRIRVPSLCSFKAAVPRRIVVRISRQRPLSYVPLLGKPRIRIQALNAARFQRVTNISCVNPLISTFLKSSSLFPHSDQPRMSSNYQTSQPQIHVQHQYKPRIYIHRTVSEFVSNSNCRLDMNVYIYHVGCNVPVFLSNYPWTLIYLMGIIFFHHIKRALLW